ncbi:M48 family metalloprotease [Streptomyces achromogenes]|uniref:M48 family metalloprotease n=1 Tax=Streptomyces achromogenes TaxID=67255 RepID=UPI0004C6B022|nr:M48 family metalloprotease [Streptomyces achromogenes]
MVALSSGARAAEQPADAAPLDERVLAAGTTLRFALLLALLVAASVSMIPRTVWHLLASSEKADREAACFLAAGIDPSVSANASFVQSQRQPAALEECTARFAQDFTTVSVGVGLVALAAAFTVHRLLPLWRTRRTRVVPLDVVDVHGRLRPLLDELVTVAGLGRTPRFVVDPASRATGAVAFGRSRRPVIRLDGGLVVTADSEQERFRAVVLHELAHLHHKDIDITYAAVALWRVFLVLVLLPWTGVGLDILLLRGSAEVRGVYAPFNTHAQVLGGLLVLAVYLSRLEILRHREIYADLMAVRWGASAQPWQDSAVRRHAGEGWRRPFVRIAALWHTHPSPALRRASLADPMALFTLRALPLFLTGLAADILVWHLDALPYEFLWLGTVLVAGLVVGIGGVALWRAVLYALRAGRTIPSGWSAGLWLGLGVVVGELTGPRAAMNQWLPAHPEALLILVAALVLLMTWTAQNAEWWLRARRERPPGPAMLAGLAVPALAYASVLYWWRSVGEVLTDGWPFTTAGVLASYGLPGLPPSDAGPLWHIIAVLGLLPGTLTGVGSLWWAQVLLWALPVLALVVASRPGGEGAGGGRRSPFAGPAGVLTGGIVCSAGLAVALARLRDAQLGTPGAVGPLRLAQMMVPVLVICAAMALTAAVVAALTDSRWLTAGLAAAGITALVDVAAAHALVRADAGSGPSAVAWSLSREVHLPYAVALGTPVAGLAAFVGRGAGLAGRGAALLVRQVTTGRGAGPRPAAQPSPAAQRPLRPKWRRAVRLAAVGAVVTWVGATALAVDVSASPGPASLSALVPDRAAPEPSATVSRLQHQAWAKAGGLERIEALRTAEFRYSAAFAAVSEATDDAGFLQAMHRVTSACGAMDRATRRAGAYLSVPSTAGQRMWTRVLTRHREMTDTCRALATRPDATTAEAADTARRNAIDSVDAMSYWLAEKGAIRPK